MILLNTFAFLFHKTTSKLGVSVSTVSGHPMTDFAGPIYPRKNPRAEWNLIRTDRPFARTDRL